MSTNSLNKSQQIMRTKNRVFLFLLGGLCLLFYVIAMIKFQGMPREFYVTTKIAQQK